MYSEELRIADCGLRIGAPRNARPASRHRRAFSLVEMMIVIAIIGLLAGVVTVNVRSYLIKARQEVARQDIATIVGALDTFWSQHSRYPTSDEGLEALTKATDKFPEGLLKSIPIDPWGERYIYNCPGASAKFEVICLGADGNDGGEGEDADITSYDLKN